jgi:uncharacterized membrane protein YsdA (DUF1294 family)
VANKVQTLIITALNLAAFLVFCWDKLSPSSGLRRVKGCRVWYAHFQWTGLGCCPSMLWRSGLPSGIIITAPALKLEGQIMLFLL